MEKWTYVPYLILIVVTGVVWSTEHKDIHCPHFSASPEECKSEGGMSFSHSRPETTDSNQILLSKIEKASEAEPHAIKWRKAFLLAVAISFATSFLVGGALPDWRKMYLSVLVTFVILIGSFIYYSYHIYGTAEKWTKDASAILRSRENRSWPSGSEGRASSL